jgi:hypothetical protein
MSVPFLIFLTIILGLCIYVFTKTVSNDAKNDFRLRDILSNSEEKDSVLAKSQTIKDNINSTKEATVEKVYANNIYEELANSSENQKNNNYSTTTHNNSYEETTSRYNDDTYYEKINDDACPQEDKRIYYEEEYISKNFKNQNYNRKSKNLFGYVKTFWKGITFSIGALVCIYSFIGLAYNVQTSNDALIYSLWLLIGVILIK